MVKSAAPRRFELDDAALTEIAAALPPQTPVERAALLPDVLRAWAAEDLREHFAYEGRAAIRQREKQLAATAAQARGLLARIAMLDQHGRFLLAYHVQNWREGKLGQPQSEYRPHDIDGSTEQRDEALRWLADLAEALAAPQPKPLPDKRRLDYLIVLDLAVIFELITETTPTRRINPASGRPYGPFWAFCQAVGRAIGCIGSLDRAIRDVMCFYPDREYSDFVANLQFRHAALWHVLR
jgi:hypothetical protein